MLTDKSISQVLPLVDILDSKDMGVAAIENTPLAVLVSASFPSAGDPTRPISMNLEACDTDCEKHNATFDETIAFLSKNVMQHISNAKNIIAPVVTEFAQKVIMRSSTDIEPLKTFCIVVQKLPAPMLNDGFMETIDKIGNGIYAEPEKYFKINKDFQPQFVLESMLTGSKDYDEKIKEWAASLGDVFFCTVWESVFQDINKIPSNKPVESMISLFSNVDKGTDYALAVYLLSRNMEENIIEESGFTLQEYKRYILQYKEAAAARLKRAYVAYSNEKEAKLLVLRTKESEKEIYVNADTYLDYINSGGKNEIILGAIVSGVIPYNVATLSENQQYFIEAWDRHKLINNAESKNKAIVKFRDICYSEFLNSLNDLSTIEQDYILQNSSHLEKIKQLAKEYCENITSDLVEKPYEVALKLICGCRFFYTDSEKILSTIDRISKDNPSIDIREAALIATTEYLVDYISEQIKIV